jgi:transposase
MEVIPVKKRPYRTVHVKDVDVNKVSDALGLGARGVVGIDVAKKNFVASVMNDDAAVVLTVKWAHPQETGDFLAMLKRVATGRVLEAGMEPTGTYGDAVRSLLHGAQIPVFQINAKRVHDAAEVYDGVPSSHDAKAAAIIGKLHLDGKSRPWPERTDADRQFKAATKLMMHFHDQVQQNTGKLEGELARYWPELSEILELGSPTMLAVLAEFGGPRQVAKEMGRARALIKKVGKNFLKESKIEGVLESATKTLGVPMVEEERLLLKALVRDTQRARRAGAEAEERVGALVAAHGDARNLAAAVGKATAAVLIAEAGNPAAFDSAAAYEKALGLNLKENSSGNHHGKLSVTKRGSGKARHYLYFAALRLIQRDPVARAWHEKKVQRDGGVLKMKSIIAIMRKYSRALWHVARGSKFDSSKLFDTRRLTSKAA